MDTGARIRAIYTRVLNNKFVKQSTLDKYGITQNEINDLLDGM